MRKFLLFALAAITLTACGDEPEAPEVPEKPGGTGNQNISVTNGSTNQSVYADEIESKEGLTFTTTGPWTSAIAESVPAKATYAASPEWISIDPDHGDVAGSYTIGITLDPNLSGEKRAATITITSGGKSITITVTQNAVKSDGTAPESDITSYFNSRFASALEDKGYVVNAQHILLSEVSKIEKLDVSNAGLLFLSGIEYFTALIYFGYK